MKRILKSLVVFLLGRQVGRLRKKHQFKTIGVVGSMGKTSTKLTIAQTLSEGMRVRYQDGNYNDIVSVPLVFFGHEMPSLTNPLAWLKIFLNNASQIRRAYPFDAVVVELGTDGPGQIMQFKKYLQLDIAVITAVAPEHMEFFKELRAVAEEELSVKNFSHKVIYNADLVPPEYHASMPDGSVAYSLRGNATADFHVANLFISSDGFEGDIKTHGEIFVHFAQEAVAETQLYSALAAAATGKFLGLKSSQVAKGLSAVKPVSGRLRKLRGINGSIIIDDTYNASPDAVKAGLETLYKIEAPQRIAVLGSMNELGEHSASAHKQAGELCDPDKLHLLVTIGAEANTHLAAAAETKGCQVKKFDNPYEAGDYLQDKIEENAIIFAKGSQNGVFAEETVKKILADPEDAGKLVRQSPYWLNVKQKQFSK